MNQDTMSITEKQAPASNQLVQNELEMDMDVGQLVSANWTTDEEKKALRK